MAEAMGAALDAFLQHAAVERGLAPRTIEAYASDLARFAMHLEEAGVRAPGGIAQAHIAGFLEALSAAGLSARLTANPFEAVTTVTVQIVTLLVGDQEFDSAKTLAAFALGLALFLITLTLNVAALLVVRRYREQYE